MKAINCFFICIILLVSCNTRPHDFNFTKEYSPRVYNPSLIKVQEADLERAVKTQLSEPKKIKPREERQNANLSNKMANILPVSSTALHPSIYFPDQIIDIPAIDSIVLAGLPELYKVPPTYTKSYNPYSFKFYTRLQGIQHDEINTIIQDSSGNMWMGTSGAGAIRFDGTFFSHFSTDIGFSDNIILSILEDKQGNIWFGTQNGGVCRHDGKSLTIFTIDQGMSDNTILCMFQDSRGDIWFGTQWGGVTRYDGSRFTHFTQNDGLASDRVNSITEDHQGTIWFATMGGGISGYNGDYFVNYSTQHGLASEYIYSILTDNAGNLWLGSENRGLIKFDGTTFEKYCLFGKNEDDITSITQDLSGNLWFGSRDHGLFRFDGNDFFSHREKDGLISDYIRCVMADISGNIWFGTLGQGVGRYFGNRFFHYTDQSSASDNYIRAIIQDNNSRIWLGSYNSGIYVLEGDDKLNFTRENGLINNNVRAFLKDSNGNIWIGYAGHGLSMFDGVNFTHFDRTSGLSIHGIITIMEDLSGNIWMGTASQGVVKYDGESFTYFTSENGLIENNIRKIFQDVHGNIWIASRRSGLVMFDGSSFFHLHDDNVLKSSDIMDVAADDKGNIWIGLFGKGLLFYDGEKFIHLTEREGLVNNFILSVLKDSHGDIWLGTRDGMSKVLMQNFDILNEQIMSNDGVDVKNPIILFKNYTHEEGFLGVNVHSRAMFEDDEGTIWMGTHEKVTLFFPLNDIPDTLTPKVQLTSVELYYEKINWLGLEGKHNDTIVVLGNGINLSGFSFTTASKWYYIPEKLSLSHKNNFINFKFASVTTYFENKIRYRFKLDGLDYQWSDLVKTNQVNYGNLKPGKYTFRVQAVNSEGYWSEELEFPFVIKSPWWASWWSLTLYVMIAVYFAYHMIMLRIRRKKQIELEKQKELFLMQEVAIARQSAEFKQNFLANMSHEIRTPLTGVLGMAEILSSTDLNEEQKDYLNTLMLSGENLRETINMVLDYSKIEAGKLRIHADVFSFNGLLNDAEKLFNALNKNNLTFEIIVDPDIPEFIVADQRRITQIITNLLSNAIKFTPEGKIILKASLYRKHEDVDDSNGCSEIMVEIIDTGIGVEAQHQERLFNPFFQVEEAFDRSFDGTGLGLAICKELVALMDGNIGMVPNEPKGSKFWFTFRADCAQDNTIVSSEINNKFVKNGQRSLRILLVEDKIIIQKVVMLMLSSLGHHVTIAKNGIEALEVFCPQKFDLVLMDIQMPLMDGITTVQKLKQKYNSMPPVIGLSANAFEGDREKYICLGMDEYITKPVRQEDFEKALIKVGLV
jgi:two-component system, sensor histidine kinase ChiS